MNQGAVAIVRLHPGLQSGLAALFADIRARGDDEYFHPHPFTEADAERVCGYAGADLYVAATSAAQVVGYGMLRGWDEGFDIPSLGILISASARRRGIGKMLMAYLHQAAAKRGARRIRLKVHAANEPAVSLYRNLGYVFVGEERGQMVGYLDLSTLPQVHLPNASAP